MNRGTVVAQDSSPAIAALPPSRDALRRPRKRCATLCLLVLVLLAARVNAQPQPTLQVPPGAQASPSFDAAGATDAYLATVPPDKKARSDAYFEGGYWIQLWSFLYATTVWWAFLALRWSASWRDRAEAWTRQRSLQTLIYWLQFNVVLALVTFP
jgi:STE24 endopeptidase